MADHNDPNAVNSIFSDVDVSAADVFDMFGFPVEGVAGQERVLLALTFADVPRSGAFDPDILYRIQVTSHPRRPAGSHDTTLQKLEHYVEGIKTDYFANFRPAEIRCFVDGAKVRLQLTGFHGDDVEASLEPNTVTDINVEGSAVRAFCGGRDDAFFNDLPGFFRSINYAPQFYHVPHTRAELRELPIPKTLLELEDNTLFNYDSRNPEWGYGVKKDLPDGPLEWHGTRFAKDADGNFRFVYSGRDARAGENCNAIILELPLSYVTDSPKSNRVVNAWGESWVLKASAKVETIPDHPLWIEHPFALLASSHDKQLKKYKLVDTVGQPFADAGLSEREDKRQLGANNFWLAPHFVKRVAHLGWGFGPSVSALGLPCSFDHGGSPVSVHRTYALAVEAFPRARGVLFQELNMPDDSWNPKGIDIPLRRAFEIFIPNVCAVDMDTTGTWPFGRRLEDQVATRFLSMFIDMSGQIEGKRCHIETLNDPALWAGARIQPKTVPNPQANDRAFSPDFPYLADPW